MIALVWVAISCTYLAVGAAIGAIAGRTYLSTKSNPRSYMTEATAISSAVTFFWPLAIVPILLFCVMSRDLNKKMIPKSR